MAETSSSSSNVSLTRALWERRVPQIVGSYLIGAFAFLQFLDWCASRDFFSGDWTILAFRFLALLLPSVVLLAWRLGKPGPDELHKVDKIAVPANVIAALLLVAFMALGMPFLRAGQVSVVVEDEEGNTIERVIPAAEARKRLALFPFSQRDQDPALDYLRHGLTFLTAYDLSQDIMLSVVSTQNLWADMWRVSPEDPLDIPGAAQRKMAGDYSCPFYAEGDFAREGETYVVTVRLHDTKTSRELTAHTYRNTDLFALVDEISITLRRDMGVPEYHIQETPDLPVALITSENPAAFRDFMEGINALMIGNDYAAGEVACEAAVAKDPRFGLAWFQLMQIYANGGKPELAPEAMAKTMDAIYAFPERMQFLVKATNYVVTGEPEKRLRIQQMWVELYPQDLQAISGLGQTYLQRGDYQAALETYQKGLETDDNRGLFLLQVGDIHVAQGNFDEALATYRTYTERYPENARGFMEVGDVYRSKGEYDKAWENYQNVVVLEPENSTAHAKLASVREYQGRFGEAESILLDALDDARSDMDRATIMGELKDLAANQGRLREAIDWSEKQTALAANFERPFNLAFRGLDRMVYHIHIGDTAAGLAIWRSAKPMFQDLFADADGYYRSLYGMLIESADTMALGLEQVRRFGQAFGEDKRFLIMLEAELKRFQDKPGEGADLLADFIEERPGQVFEYRQILAELQRLAGDYKAAQETIDGILAMRPRDPDGLYQGAFLADAKGDTKAKQAYLDQLFDVWVDADMDYDKWKKARALQEAL